MYQHLELGGDDRVMKCYLVCLLVSASLLGINSPASADEIRIDFGTVFNVINNVFNPPHRAAQEQADAAVAKEKARQEAEIAKVRTETQASKNVDRAAPVITKWGVERVSCAPGAVFINGVSADTICIKPSEQISAGYYTYDSTRKQLVRSTTNTATSDRHSDDLATPKKNLDPGF
jgi:DNA-directed RNA polymerase